MTEVPEAKVPFNDLNREVALMREGLDSALARVLSSGWFVMGPEHNLLESELTAFMGGADTVLVGNGTDALQIALAAIDVHAGDLVLTAANAGGYATTAARLLGADLLYADVDPLTHLLSVQSVEAAVYASKRTPKALVVTHLYGAAAPVAELTEWAHAKGVLVVEDCAQSLGATVEGKRAGTFGDISTTSFYPTKNLGALGDGGAIFTHNSHITTRARQLRQYGWETKYQQVVLGGQNSRLDEMQAAILRVKLPFLDKWNARRREIHTRYEAAAPRSIRFVNSANPSFVAHLAIIETERRDELRAHFAAHGVATDIHYPIPDHKQAAARKPSVSLPVTENLAGRILTLPLFPLLTEGEVQQIERALQAIS